jgi:iron complex transport system substrate-binding protein
MRIVSLLASATEIVCALGAGEMLVGRSHECDWPEWVRGLPMCSEPAFDVSCSSAAIDAEVRRRIAAGEEMYRVNGDLIRALRPDLVIAQSHCEVCAVTPEGVARGGECLPMLALSAATVEGVFESIGQVSFAIGREGRGREVVARERERLRVVSERTAGLRRPTVVMLEWTEPLFAMGNWGPELVEMANGELLIGKKGEYSSTVTGELVAEADPEFVIVAPCGFDLARTMRERAVMESYVWWRGLRAVRAGKVAFADGNRFFNRSGMTIAWTAEIIAEILHGVTFGAAGRGEHCLGEHWRWIGNVG